jgi:hypothetical protein
MPLNCSKKLKTLPSNIVFDLQVFVHFHSITSITSSCNKLTMANWTLLQQQLGQLQHNGVHYKTNNSFKLYSDGNEYLDKWDKRVL